MRKKYFIFIVLCVYTLFSFSQNKNEFEDDFSSIIHKDDVIVNLKQKRSNLFIDTHIEHDSLELMLESGTSGLILDEMFYDNFKDKSLFNLKTSNKRFRTVLAEESIKYSGTCELHVGDFIYKGPVFILEGECQNTRSIPIQYIKHPKNKKSHISLDYNNKKIIIHKKLNKIKLNKDTISFSYNKDGEPIVNTKLYFTNYDSDIELIGNYIIDFGNTSLLYLNTNIQEVSDSLSSRNIKFDIARGRDGKVIGKGIFAPKMNLFGKSYKNVSIGITDKLKSIKEFGYIGYKAFARPVTFDFEKNKIYFW